MSSAPRHGMPERWVRILRLSIAITAPSATAAGLFGSRATGRHRPNSDIDLVLYGPVSTGEASELRVALEDSPLPVSVDVVVYDRLDSPSLKAHIDQVLLPLFDAAALFAAPLPVVPD